MVPHNRIKDCWEARDMTGELVFCATPIAAVLEEIRKERVRLVILPMQIPLTEIR